MHTRSKRFNLNPLIQLQDATQDENEMKGLSLIGPQREHGSNTHIWISKDVYFSFDLERGLNIDRVVCFANLRGSWTTNYKTKTTLCLFLLFTGDSKWTRNTQCNVRSSQTAFFSLHHLCTLHPLPHHHILTTHHSIGRRGRTGHHREVGPGSMFGPLEVQRRLPRKTGVFCEAGILDWTGVKGGIRSTGCTGQFPGVSANTCLWCLDVISSHLQFLRDQER